MRSPLQCLGDPGSVVGMCRPSESLAQWQLRALQGEGWLTPGVSRGLLVRLDSILSLILYRERNGISDESRRELDILLNKLRKITG